MVSIIIPCKRKEEADECVRKCLEMSYQNFEIIVLPDYNISYPDGQVKYICTGEVFPAEKRNIGVRYARGDVLAFIDSDAYPPKYWLSNVLTYLEDGAVCGPGILPLEADWRERVSDYVYRMLPFKHRVIACHPRYLDEFPTFNLVIKRDCFVPFQNFLTGEDSLLCREIRKQHKILYVPSLFVYHHRRPIMKPLLKQVFTYGKHRGHILKLIALGTLPLVLFAYGLGFIYGMFKRKL